MYSCQQEHTAICNNSTYCNCKDIRSDDFEPLQCLTCFRRINPQIRVGPHQHRRKRLESADHSWTTQMLSVVVISSNNILAGRQICQAKPGDRLLSRVVFHGGVFNKRRPRHPSLKNKETFWTYQCSHFFTKADCSKIQLTDKTNSLSLSSYDCS